MTNLKFKRGNAKLGRETLVFSLPAGWTCPAAKLCFSRANQDTGKLTDGPHNQFRCYAASSETLFSNVRKGRWKNFEALKACQGSTVDMINLIERSIAPFINSKCLPVKRIRIHESGDFFSQAYFDAWLIVAITHPTVIFYAYTKALPFWISRKNILPSNLRLTASYGGRYDALIEKHSLKYVKVVFSELEAVKLGLKIDHDDSRAWKLADSFAILLHGTQPAETPAAKAWQAIKTKGRGGYKANYFAHYQKGKR